MQTLTQQVENAEAQVEIAADTFRRTVDCYGRQGWRYVQAYRSLTDAENRLGALYYLSELADLQEDHMLGFDSF